MAGDLAGSTDVIPGIGGPAAAPRLAAFDMDPSVTGAMPPCESWPDCALAAALACTPVTSAVTAQSAAYC